MTKQTSSVRPAGPADIRQAAELLDAAVDACADLLNAQHRLALRLHNAGLITDQTVTAVLAREDQVGAAITDLRTLGNFHTR
jgi:hypothetical protein